jgi:putative membrane protein
LIAQVSDPAGGFLEVGPAAVADRRDGAAVRPTRILESMMRALAIRWVSNVVALYVATWLLSGVTYGDEWWSLLIAAAVFTLINAWVKPVITILSIPFIVVTLGFFYLLVNVFMLYLTDWVVGDFEISTFWTGLLAAIIVGVVNFLLGFILPGDQ